jgi:alpha-L-fucosidase
VRKPRPDDNKDITKIGEFRPGPEDIDIDGLAKLARKNQSGIIVVDRAVGGRYENYRTPEQKIPDKPLPYPWETCMTLGDSWSYVPNDKYKSARAVVQILVDVVAKGGNYLLNVGPDGNGELPVEAVARLREIGEWMKINGDAIYKTRPIAPYKSGKISFTALKDGTVNAIYLADERENAPPAQIRIIGVTPWSGARLRMIGSDSVLKWHAIDGGIVVDIPESIRKSPPSKFAWTIVIPTK